MPKIKNARKLKGTNSLQNSDSSIEDSTSDVEVKFSDRPITHLDNDESNATLESTAKPAWIDEDDIFTCQEVIDIQGRKCKLGTVAGKNYKASLEDRYNNLMGVPKWAKPSKKFKQNNLLSTTGTLLKKSTGLVKGAIELQKLKDLNYETHIEGPIVKCVLFHPSATVSLVAGSSGLASIFKVDGGENAKLQTVQFQRFPISCASFLRNGEEYIVGSKYHNYFYSNDLTSGHSQQVSSSRITDLTNVKNFRVTPDGKHIAVYGKFGNIYLLSSTTKEYICTLRMNGEVSALDFYSNMMYSHGTDGEVYVWDMNTRDCVHKFVDDGCLHGTAVAAAPNGQLLATGSSSGVVNIYHTDDLKSKTNPLPTKILYNLVTGVNSLKFNVTSELLCLASDYKENAVKLLHTPSMSVYSNFPSFQAKFNRVQCVSFSPNSGYLAFGDNKSSAHLFRLKYYGNY